MPLGDLPVVTDDSGTGTDGTAVDKAWFDDLIDSLEDSIFSTANPTISPAEAIDELVDARGTFDTLGERLDDLSGTTVTTDADSSTLAASENVARNPDLASWSQGAAAAPDEFALSGTGASVARATGLGSGLFAARITFGSDTAKLTQDLIPIAEFTNDLSLGSEGRKVSVTARVAASIADQATLVIDDGVTTTESDAHTGSGNPENLTSTHTISSSATKLSFYVKVAQAGVVDCSGFIAVYSDNPAPSWQPPPRQSHRVLYLNVTPAGNVGAPATDMMTYKVAPNLLKRDGMAIHVVGRGYTAANATAKKVDFKWGTKTFSVFPNSAQNAKAWSADVWIVRKSTASQALTLLGGVYTSQYIYGSTGAITITEDETTEITLKFIGDANATNDIVQDFMMVEVVDIGAGI